MRSWILRLNVLLVLTATAVATLLVAPSSADRDPVATLPADLPAAGTPQVLDGRVLSVVRIGNTIVLGGTFRRVQDGDGGEVLRRPRLVAFDVATGRVLRSFAPAPDGDVNVVQPGPTGTIHVGGEFRRIGGAQRPALAQLRLDSGAAVRTFNAGRVDGDVRDLRRTGSTLWAAGSFTTIGGQRRTALATLNIRTGRMTRHLTLAVSGQHRTGLGRTAVEKIDVSPDGRRLVAIGNFRRVGTKPRQQLAVLDIGRRQARLTRFATTFYAQPCLRRFYTYVRDVAFSGDGRFFVVGTTGGYGGATSPCDSVARFETATAGANVAPSWVAHTGGDTVHAVEIDGGVVYAGGHHRWFNNPLASGTPGPGAVPRPGIAALSTLNGLPFSWNPGRTKGVGVFDFLVTADGLWVASDTDRLAGQVRGRIALLPRLGSVVPEWRTPRIPALVVGAGPSGLTARSFDGQSFSSGTDLSSGDLDWTTVRAAFLVAGKLHVVADGTLTVRAFDPGTGVTGPASPLAATDMVSPPSGWASDLVSAGAMFYDRGRLYYTRTDSSGLYFRWFNPESGVVGARRFSVAGPLPFSASGVRSLFLAGTSLHWLGTDGVLRRAGWQSTPQAARPFGRATVVPARVAGPDGPDGPDGTGGSEPSAAFTGPVFATDLPPAPPAPQDGS